MNPTIEREKQIQQHKEIIDTLKKLTEKVESLEKEISKLIKKQSKES